MKKKAQVTIFIILAIVIAASIILYFSLDISFTRSVPQEMRPIYDYYLSCLEEEAEMGIALMGEQGGYIEIPDFVPGSPYSPTSSQLDFFGQGVPYWMYLSGNNILNEQVPELDDMESQLGNYLEERLDNCDFSDFEEAGYYIYVEEESVDVKINPLKVNLDFNNKITIFKDENSVTVDSYDISISSKLGKFYNLALEVYEKEKSLMFLEDYAIDVMRLYAPVDGVELTCVPQIFVDEKIRADLYDGLESNINAIKLDGDYYELSNEANKYFVADFGFNIEENANIMYDRNWPSRIEIYGDRIVQPIGVQEGLSALGFCYVPYHLVYDISFPVMIQFYDSENFFQFPISVIIDNNQPREAVKSGYSKVGIESEVCKYNNADLKVYTYDSELGPVEAILSFKCLDSICDIGETKIQGSSAVFVGESPQCVNGFVIATAEGYAQGKAQISTNSESLANILLKKKYTLPIEFEGIITETVAVTFSSEEYSTTVVYPEFNEITLIEGDYEVSAFVYEDSALKFPGTSEDICVDVPVSGIGGFIGLEEEKCYNVDIPEMEIDMAVIGGGNSFEYIAESMLKDSQKLNFDIEKFGKPNSLEDLQENYDKVQSSYIILEFE